MRAHVAPPLLSLSLSPLRMHVCGRIPSARVHNARGPCWKIYIRGTKGRNVFTQLSPHRRAEPSPTPAPIPHHRPLESLSALEGTTVPSVPPLPPLPSVPHGRQHICMECIHMKSTILPTTSRAGCVSLATARVLCSSSKYTCARVHTRERERESARAREINPDKDTRENVDSVPP